MSMQLEVVAEGVEKPDQADRLRSLGAHTAQGWMYAKGMPEGELFDWLREWDKRPGKSKPS
jgi:sensor c-di-GMP phosphodiesterase-like protein